MASTSLFLTVTPVIGANICCLAIVKLIKKYPNVAFALLIEPDSLPNLVTNADKTACSNSASGYRDGVAYAIKNLNLPNVVMYLDAGHGGWLGWDANLKPGAAELAKAYKAGGSPKQLRGFATNTAGWNAWYVNPHALRPLTLTARLTRELL